MKEYLELIYNSADLLTWIFAGVLLLSAITQAVYYLFVFRKLSAYTPPEIKAENSGITVIICAKNEADNLRKNLPAFLLQNYPNYEVVVVNDSSTDETEDVLAEMMMKYPKLRYTSIPVDNKFTHGKKLAVTIGIKAAKNEHLLFSDADCYPASDEWVSHMAQNFSDKNEIVLGIGKYKYKKGLLNTIIRYETMFTAMQYISLAIKNKPFMGVGRNMAYKKELFFKHKGFASHLKILSGDDDLFINQAATSTNTCVEISPDSFTISSPPETLKQWLKQKKRHLSTGKYYKRTSKWRLGLEYFSRMLFYTSFIWMLFLDHWLWIALGVYFILSCIRLLITKLTMKRLEEQDLLLPSLILDLVLPLVLFGIRISNIIRPREAKWS